MSRELKFRAWNSKTKEFEYFELHNITVSDRLLCQHDYPVQQFTGLKDKNGKDIYEGDLINFSVDNTFPLGDKDIWDYYSQEVYYDEKFAVFLFGKEGHQMLDRIMEETIEVVGNIFEAESK